MCGVSFHHHQTCFLPVIRGTVHELEQIYEEILEASKIDVELEETSKITEYERIHRAENASTEAAVKPIMFRHRQAKLEAFTCAWNLDHAILISGLSECAFLRPSFLIRC